MSTQVTRPPGKGILLGSWLEVHSSRLAGLLVLIGFLTRLWTAYGTFLNPDEALHFRLANQPSLAEAYKQALTAAHPPGLVILLYFWRDLGRSELWLRLPSVVAGMVFCWVFYKWLAAATGKLTGMIGVLFAALLPPIVGLTAEIRQYALLLAFLACALYFLDRAFAEKSARLMAAFSFFLYLAMFMHYSAFLFAIALGIYAIWRIVTEHPPFKVTSAWAIGQMIGVGIAVFLYKVHLSRLGVGDSRTVLQGFMSDFFLRRSYYNPAHDSPLWFVGHSFGVFQYFFGQLAVGDLAGLLFLAGVGLLLRQHGTSKDSGRRAAALLVLPFAVACIASVFHLYPYGGARELAFLIIPALGGVSVALAGLSHGDWARGVGLGVLVLALCLIFGKPRPPRMERADQSRRHMDGAMQFVRQNVPPGSTIFVDYQSNLILGHYLCDEQPIVLDDSIAGFESFSCSGHRVISANYKSAWMFNGENFVGEWKSLAQTYGLHSGGKVWNFQCGWGIKLAGELQKNFAEFRDLRVTSFGENIQIFPLTVGQAIPASDMPSQRATGMLSPNAFSVRSSGVVRPSFLTTTPKLPE
ncbi:MAG TPA: glycosyltransferase family 39 protein [Candidatus Aquilonibacter sp.]|nr:glycosyltransferase family 39 protein [Candidatus Aquilonibacter sp.]